MQKILITGATGQLGTSVLETLVKQISPQQINVLSRKEDKLLAMKAQGFNTFLGSYDDVLSLENAMQGVDTALLISSGDQGDRMQEHKNVIDTARKCGVQNIAYTSRALRDRTTLANKLMKEHFETEDYINTSGLNYIFFRNALYMDTIPQFVGGNMAIERGIFQPAGDGKVAFALRSEMGEAMAKALLINDFNNKIYNFTGDKTYSFHDIAAILSALSGKTVKYNAIDDVTYSEMMTQRNIPAFLIQKILDFITDIKHNQEADIYPDLEILLGRKPTNLKDGLKVLFNL